MKILLIKPYWSYPYSRGEYTYNRIWPPLCLANCAAILEKEGFDVKILDAHAERIQPEKIARYICGYDKIFITSSSLDRWQCPNIDIKTFLETVKYCKEKNDEVFISGYHGTVEPERILGLTGAKAVIIGEPECTILDICRNNNLSKIQGVFFKDDGQIVSNPKREPLDFKKIPIPAYHLLDFKKYFYEILGGRFSLFEISRGCHYKCTFCNKIMYGGGVRSKSSKQIIEEVTIAIEKYKIKTGFFMDLDFLSNRIIVEELCDYLIKKKYRFKWSCQTRPDFLDMEILRKLKNAGCEILHMGIESGSQNSLKEFNKNMNIKTIFNAFRMCNVVGIKILSFFLFGLSDETNQDREDTLNLVKKLNPDFVSFHKVYPYKGSVISQDNISKNSAADRFIRKAFIKFYLRFSYVSKLNPYIILCGPRLLWGRIKTL